MSEREAFLAGDRPDDVCIYLADSAVSSSEPLAEFGSDVGDGTILVLPGEEARDAFRATAGIDPMSFPTRARNTEGTVAPDLTGGTCPAASEEIENGHDARFVFAFAEAQNESVGGLYAEGDVVHAYVSCACGEAYSQRWLAGER